MSPRWRKVSGDVRLARGRFLMMGAALTAGITAIAAILVARAILVREVPANYLDTRPASAQIELDRVDASTLAVARAFPGIADAEAGAKLAGRLQLGEDEWMPLLLFVIPDFGDLRINRVRAQSGAWPPPAGTILVERSALPLTRRAVGSPITLQVAGGAARQVRIAGTVHDAGVAPASQEQTIYAYATPATVAGLGEDAGLDLLKIIVAQRPGDSHAIEATARQLAERLRQRGRQVHEIRIPPPLRHPHQGQLNAVLGMLRMFSLLALVLGAVLTATVVGGLLAQQTRQIAIMKAIGARSRQIAVLYLGLVAAIGAVSAAVGLPLGAAVGRGFVAAVADLLNLEIASDTIPLAVCAAVIALGILAPVLAAAVPILLAASRTVRAAIDDHGVDRQQAAFDPLGRLLSRIRLTHPAATLALRNTFRRRGRFTLTLALLAVAGAMFIASANLRSAWQDYVAEAAAYRHYDLELRLQRPVDEPSLTAAIAQVPGVGSVESWAVEPAAVDRGHRADVVRTYPDGGHGGFTLRTAPARTGMVDVHLLQGRWLNPDDTDAIVLNQSAHASNFPGVRPGDWISLRSDGHPLRLRVAGIARELITPAAGYVRPATLAAADIHAGLSNAVRVRIAAGDTDAVARSIVAALGRRQIGVESVLTEKLFGAAQAGHIFILVFALGFLATMMGLVGTLGLASTLSTSVIERTREIGVMRAVGASASDVRHTVLGEGLCIGLLSWILAVPLSLPLSQGVGSVLASISSQPLTLTLSPGTAASWLAIVLLAAAAASLFPARRAGQLSVRQVLATT
jgi:putative ABC transport system permease protein